MYKNQILHKNLKYIFINIKFITNFKPYLFSKTKTNLFKKNIIYCKKFFILFLILEYFLYNKKYSKKHSLSFFCIKKKLNKLTFLRTANRAKSSQVNLTLARYIICIKIIYFLNNLLTSKPPLKKFIYLLNYFLNFFKFSESNIFYIHSLSILLPLVLKYYLH